MRTEIEVKEALKNTNIDFKALVERYNENVFYDNDIFSDKIGAGRFVTSRRVPIDSLDNVDVIKNLTIGIVNDLRYDTEKEMMIVDWSLSGEGSFEARLTHQAKRKTLLANIIRLAPTEYILTGFFEYELRALQ